MKNIFFAILTIFMIIGCNETKTDVQTKSQSVSTKTIDLKEASIENFKNILQRYYNKQNKCIRLEAPYNVVKFPFTLILDRLDNRYEHNNKITDEQNKRKIAELDPLVKAGILTVKDSKVMKEHNWLGKKSMKEHKTKVYALTEKGKKNFEEGKEANFGLGTRASWCVGEYQVDEVVNFTQPTPIAGMTISRVNYIISPRNVLEWAKNEDVIKTFRLMHNMKIKQKKSTGLVLMNDGWTHEKEANFR